MKNDYKKHIISTDKHQVWLHRTHLTNIESILKNGLHYGSGDLSSTATIQSENLERAESSYRMTHKGSNAVIVIKIPSTIADKYYTAKRGKKGIRHHGYDMDKEVTYFENGQYKLQRQHIHGYINSETDEYHENPYRNKPQQLTDKHFPALIYGGLEKDLIEPKKEKGPRTLSKKTSRLKRGELPPPPEEIVIP